MNLLHRITNSRLWRNGFKFLPDHIYLKIMWKGMMGTRLDLKNPKSFNEKLQWIKINDRKSYYSLLADKHEVKRIVAGIIGAEYIIPTLKVYELAEDIDFSELPSQFVLKCTHDSGSVIVCRDKSKLDEILVKKTLKKALKTNFYWLGREWPYKDIKPRVIAEKYMENEGYASLKDYKFYCFNGKVELLYLSEGLENHNTARISFVTLDWEFAPFQRDDYPGFEKLPEKPKNLDKMIEIAQCLSKDIKFVRVDLYEINSQLYFSEMTFTPCSGFMPFQPKEYDIELGKKLIL